MASVGAGADRGRHRAAGADGGSNNQPGDSVANCRSNRRATPSVHAQAMQNGKQVLEEEKRRRNHTSRCERGADVRSASTGTGQRRGLLDLEDDLHKATEEARKLFPALPILEPVQRAAETWQWESESTWVIGEG